MNETIFQIDIENLDCLAETGYIENELLPAFFENHFLQLSKYDLPDSQLFTGSAWLQQAAPASFFQGESPSPVPSFYLKS